MKSKVWKAWETQFERFLHETSFSEDAAHDISHIYRVVNTAKSFAQAEQAVLEVVIPAAWLHDCVQVPKNHPDRAKASQLAAQEAIIFLQECGYPDRYHEAIAHAIEAHSFSAGIAPQTLEAKIVQDADRLDALGAEAAPRVGPDLDERVIAPRIDHGHRGVVLVRDIDARIIG